MAVQRLQNVRPRFGDYDEESDLEHGDASDDGQQEHDDEEDGLSQDGENGNEAVEDDGEDFEQKMSTVSFGALKQAQDSLSRKRKRGSETTADQDGKLQVLRQRLQEIKDKKAAAGSNTAKSRPDSKDKPKLRSRAQDDEDSDEDDSADSDSGPSEEDAPNKSRTSKHAPAVQSSKRQVTRKRNVVEVPKRVIRDPRFDAINQWSAHPDRAEKAYSFLRDYEKSEIEELKVAMKRTKDEDDKEVLKRKIGSMENRIKAKVAKEREQEVIRQHRKEEKERVQQGKTPYYLKKKDVKERVLVEKFKGMKSKDREKLIEKRKRKEGQKEKKRMPEARRLAG